MTILDFFKQPIVIQTVILIITTTLTFLFRLRYSETKQINQATKEDIGEITKIVESVKLELAQKTEELKAEFALSNQHKLNWKVSEREAIVNFNNKLTDWYLFLKNFTTTTFIFNEFKDIVDLVNEINKRSYQSDIAYSHLKMFIADSEINTILEELREIIVNYNAGILKETQSSFSIQIKYAKAAEDVGDHNGQKTLKLEMDREISDSWYKFHGSSKDTRLKIDTLFSSWTTYAGNRIKNIQIY